MDKKVERYADISNIDIIKERGKEVLKIKQVSLGVITLFLFLSTIVLGGYLFGISEDDKVGLKVIFVAVTFLLIVLLMCAIKQLTLLLGNCNANEFAKAWAKEHKENGLRKTKAAKEISYTELKDRIKSDMLLLDKNGDCLQEQTLRIKVAIQNIDPNACIALLGVAFSILFFMSEFYNALFYKGIAFFVAFSLMIYVFVMDITYRKSKAYLEFKLEVLNELLEQQKPQPKLRRICITTQRRYDQVEVDGMPHSILSMDSVAGTTIISVAGKGIGLKNNSLVRDDNGNEFLIKSVAMTKGDDFADETVLVVEQIRKQGDISIGRQLHVVK